MSSEDKTLTPMRDLGEETLEKLDEIVIDQLRLTVERVVNEIAIPSGMTEAESKTLSQATGYGMLAHMVMAIAKMEGPESAIGSVMDIMIQALEAEYPGMNIETHLIGPNTNQTTH